MSKRTTGKWEFSCSQDGRRGSIFVEGKETICSYDPSDDGYSDTKVANFTLMAAAPDMYEALMHIRNNCNRSDSDIAIYGEAPIKQWAAVALAKADGKL